MVLGLLNPQDTLPEGTGLPGASCSGHWPLVTVFVPVSKDHIPDSHQM